MKQLLLIFSTFLFAFGAYSQGNWKFTEVASLPIPTTNNAVCKALINKNKFLYSFGGITDSLHLSNIHQRVFKYDVSNDTWTETLDIPDTLGKIGSSASFVKNRIYIIGGKHILPDSSEVHSKNVHVYNPFLDTFEINGSDLPIPVSDHVQSVWRDSLIFVVSGSNGIGTLPDVQIYNPSFNSWSIGNSTPNNSDYKSFGASGYIMADTIFYFGGATDGPNFETTNTFRKGVINKNDPTQINWSIVYSNPGNPIFKGACSGHNNTIFWVGGSKKAHNYGGTEMNTNAPVVPNQRVLEYSVKDKLHFNQLNTPYSVMDLNGIAKLGGGNWMIAGGIDSLQQPSNRTLLIHNKTLSDIEKASQPPLLQVQESGDYYVIITENIGKVIVYDLTGRTLYNSDKQLADLYIPKSKLSNGILLFVYDDSINLPVHIKKIKPN
ncbi:MAG TPA: hypothetical protein VKY37_01395 [Brumimicrobium sp.]|nr:hypothetical protein [Brumimicrobium sp.]